MIHKLLEFLLKKTKKLEFIIDHSASTLTDLVKHNGAYFSILVAN